MLALALLVGGCGAPDRPSRAGRGGVSDAPVKTGRPYQVGGRTYVPADDRGYRATGMASWYGGAHRGRPTANGERFDPDAITAAHATLPLPSYVEVTALDSGRRLIVRVNDRGPFAAGRIVDLSRAAARELGIERAGVARVMVRRVQPSEGDRAALRKGRMASALPPLAGRDLAVARGAPASSRSMPSEPMPPGAATTYPSSSPTPVAPPAAGRGADPLYVQVAAFASPEEAVEAVSRMRAGGPVGMTPLGPMWRVRLGPLANDGEVASALARARAAGYQDARVVRESAP